MHKEFIIAIYFRNDKGAHKDCFERVLHLIYRVNLSIGSEISYVELLEVNEWVKRKVDPKSPDFHPELKNANKDSIRYRCFECETVNYNLN